jgi:hypothetical protein
MTRSILHPVRTWLVCAVILALLTWWGWEGGAARRVLRRLPEAERSALYERTAKDLQQVCNSPPAALQPYCDQQAEFLLSFPECDADCRALAGEQLSRHEAVR